MTTVLVKNKVEEFATKIAANNLPVWKEVAQIRESGIEALKQLEFPTTRNEYWKYSRVSKITKHTSELVTITASTVY